MFYRAYTIFDPFLLFLSFLKHIFETITLVLKWSIFQLFSTKKHWKCKSVLVNWGEHMSTVSTQNGGHYLRSLVSWICFCVLSVLACSPSFPGPSVCILLLEWACFSINLLSMYSQQQKEMKLVTTSLTKLILSQYPLNNNKKWQH